MNNELKQDLLTVAEAALLMNLKVASIYNAIRIGRLYANKVLGKLCLSHEDIQQYIETKWCSRYTRRDEKGSLIFNQDDGTMSVPECADYLNVTLGKVYYLLRKGVLPYKRLNWTYIIQKSDIDKLKEKQP